MICEIPWLKKHRGFQHWSHPVAPHLRWSSGIQMPLRSVAQRLHFTALRGSHQDHRKKMMAVDVRFDVCFECVVLGWQLPELPKEHVSNYVFPMRCWGTSAASKTFRWSNSSAGGFWRGVIGVLADSGLMWSHRWHIFDPGPPGSTKHGTIKRTLWRVKETDIAV